MKPQTLMYRLCKWAVSTRNKLLLQTLPVATMVKKTLAFLTAQIFRAHLQYYSHIEQLFHIQGQTGPKKILHFNVLAVLRIRLLFDGLSKRTPEFDSRQIHVGFELDKVALGQVLLQRLRLSTVKTSPPHFTLPSPSNWEYRSIRYLKLISLWTALLLFQY
jgi:hypothetical protein